MRRFHQWRTEPDRRRNKRTTVPSWPFTGKPYRSMYPPQATPLSLADEQAAYQNAIAAQQAAAMSGVVGLDPSISPGPQGPLAPHHPHPLHSHPQQMVMHPAVANGGGAGGGQGSNPAAAGMPPPPPPGSQAAAVAMGMGPYAGMNVHSQHQQQMAMMAAAAAAEEDDDADISGAASISNRWAEEENNAKAGWTDVRGTRGAVEMARGGTAIRAARMAPERGRRSADIVADRGGRNVDWRL